LIGKESHIELHPGDPADSTHIKGVPGFRVFSCEQHRPPGEEGDKTGCPTPEHKAEAMRNTNIKDTEEGS
jgi:hypothetical protein